MIYSRLSDGVIEDIEKGYNELDKTYIGIVARFDNYATKISDILDSHYLYYDINFNFGMNYLVVCVRGSFLYFNGQTPVGLLVDEADGKLTLETYFKGYKKRRVQELALEKIGFAISHYVLGNNCKYCIVDVYPEFR